MSSPKASVFSWVLTGSWDPAARPKPPEVERLSGSPLRLVFGPWALVLLTPFIAQWIWVVVYYHHGSVRDFLQGLTWERLWEELPVPSWSSLCLVVAWVFAQALLLWLLPGERFEGPLTPRGNTPKYRRNGVLAWVLTHALLTLGLLSGRLDPLSFWRGYGSMLATLNAGALMVCAFLYWKGRRWPSSTDARLSGHFAFDFFQGVELHPTLFGADVKQWINCRVSMMGWSASTLVFAFAHTKLSGHLHLASGVCAALTMVYLFKFFVWESGYFHSLDIMHDRFGYYICWGVLSWVPAVYCLPAMYIAQREGDLHPAAAAVNLLFGLVSIGVNYAADAQRQLVRRTGGACTVWGRKPEIIYARYRTADGVEHPSVLLTSGYWGLARHFHYVPEILLALAWTLPAGTLHALPYFYVVFLTILLVDRARRDDLRCREKYKEHWDEYCQRVPWKILPGVY